MKTQAPSRRAICVTLSASLYQVLVAVALALRGSSQKRPDEEELKMLQHLGLAALLRDTNGCQRIHLTPAGWLLAENIPQVMCPQPPVPNLN